MNSMKPEAVDTKKGREISLKNIQKDLPDCWIVQFSRKHANRVYYFNTITGDRSWKHPSYSADKADTTNKAVEKRLCGQSGRKRKSDERNPELQVKSKRQINVSLGYGQQDGSKRETVTSNPDILKKKSRIHKPKRASKDLRKSHSNVNHRSKGNKTELKKQSCGDVLPSDFKQDKEVSVCKERIRLENSRNNEDVEMFDLCASLGGHADIARQTESMEKEFVFILDTNIFLDPSSLALLESFLSRASAKEAKAHSTRFLVPWVVLQELDNLKKNKVSARNAVSFLNRYFRDQALAIRGQSIFEAARVIDGLKIESNDDRILQCCFFVQQSSSTKLPVLITKDKNLMNKALTNNLKCFGGLAELHGLIHGEKTKSELKSQKSVTSQEMTRLDLASQNDEKTHCDTNNNSQSSCSQSSCSSPVDHRTKKDLLEKSRKYLLAVLSLILETEMKAAFDDLWLDVILRKPPWSLSDVLKCMQKHWFSVFGMANVDRLVEVQLKHLTELNTKIDISSVICEDYFLKWLRGAQNLILGLTQQRKFGSTVDENLTLLKDVENEMTSAISKGSHDLQHPAKETKCHEVATEKQDKNVDAQMTEERVDCSSFWIALNQIWTSIISHCGMLFQSLHFVPTQIENAPEIQQALCATFDYLPERISAIHALPLVVEIVQSVKNVLEKLLHCYSRQGADSDAIFADLLQTLWAAIQAFSIHCDLSDLMRLRSETSRIISVSSDMLQRLNLGFQQLCVVLGFLVECRDIVSQRFMAQS